jgi:hypothetical protein
MLSGLISVTIPEGVTTIGDHAFAGNDFVPNASLTSVTIPSSVTSFEGWVFWHCASLTNATIANGATTLGTYTFQGCSSLTSFTIPKSVTTIGTQVFSDCTSLTNCPIPDSVTDIGSSAFGGSSLSSVTIPDSVTSIEAVAFDGCYDPTNVIIPASVTSFGGYEFFGCSRLTSVYYGGDAPAPDSTTFSFDNNATVYYLPGTTGWSSPFDGVPTALWRLPYPVILNNSPSFGVQSNTFGFTISWATNRSLVVEACTNLANPVWTPLQSLTLTNGLFYFSNAQWTNYPARFYRISSP